MLRTISQPGTSEVLEGVDGDGTRWFAKRVDRSGQWTREVRAYRNWVPALGDRAPQLKAADKRLQSLVISAVPGDRGPLFDPELHRTAGRLLSRFHHSQSPRPAPDGFGGRMLHQLDAWLARVDGLFTDAEVGYAREQARGLAEFPRLVQIPSHGDYRPNNWLVGDDGVVRVIDFGNSCWHVRAFDLSRLHYGPWPGNGRARDHPCAPVSRRRCLRRRPSRIGRPRCRPCSVRSPCRRCCSTCSPSRRTGGRRGCSRCPSAR